MSDLTNGTQNRMRIEDIRFRLQTGEISYEQAKAEAKPIIAKMNARGAEIARESGFRYKPLSFTGLMR